MPSQPKKPLIYTFLFCPALPLDHLLNEQRSAFAMYTETYTMHVRAKTIEKAYQYPRDGRMTALE